MLLSASRRLCLFVVPILAALLAAPAAGAQARRQIAPPSTPKPFLDVRDAKRRDVARRHDTSLRPPSAMTRSARARLRSAGAVVRVDALTGTPRFLAGRSAALSPPAAGDRRDVADRWIREHLPALGLSRTDLGSLRLDQRVAIPGRVEQLGYRQYAAGIPSFDGGLRVVVDSGGRVVSVSGSPQPSLSVSGDVPTLTAVQAMRRVMEGAGVRRPTDVASGPTGTRRTTRFTSGETAALVVFGEGTSARLGWELDLRAGPGAHYAAVVDARTGALLYRANRIKAAADDALVWEQYPGAANGGTAQVQSLTPYLFAGATDLSGPYAHAWSDVNDNDSGDVSSDGHIVPLDQPDPGETVTRAGTGGSFMFPFDEFTAAENSAGACNPTHKCSWNFDVPTSWQTNRRQDAVQAFYYVNRFRDHLRASPISFSPSDGNFDDGDRVLVNTDDGAATDTSGPGAGGPDANHIDNAYMDTPPNGTSPTMAMFLWFNNGDFRDANGGDDAAIVFHEYTHGLSGRLVTVAPGGEQALNGDQSGAMGEGWSDWYAKDFLVSRFPSDDTVTAGDVDMGKYLESVPHMIRTQGLDCPVGAPAAQCPGSPTAGSGGYTYGDFGVVRTGPEVHADGEIWGETLWDLRGAVGSAVARAIVTQGMRVSPAEPTFLDERDAILTADRQLFRDGDHSGAIWQVFAHRGMGWDAQSPTQDTTLPGSKRPPTAALALSPSPAAEGQPVSFDASGSSDPDGQVTSFDFDFDGDGVDEITGTTDPRATFAYSATGTFHPTVTVHDDEGQLDTAARALQVGGGTGGGGPSATPTPPAGASPVGSTGQPPAGGPPAGASTAPRIVLARSGTRGRVRITVSCDSACAGTATLTISRALARTLHRGSHRTVGRVRIRLAAAGRKRFTLRLTALTRASLRRVGRRRIVTRLAVTVTDAEGQRAASRRRTPIRR